jgi:hypothetical protein
MGHQIVFDSVLCFAIHQALEKTGSYKSLIGTMLIIVMGSL